MSNSKATRRALLTSVLALVMCVSMLIGTTAAWFTDTVTSSGNKVVSGTLKVDLQVLEDDNSGWTSVKDSKAPIFDYDNWEPGYVQVKILKVVNIGSLAFKWQANLVTTEELGILADVIDVYVKEDVESYPENRTDLSGWTKVGTLRSFISGIETTTVGEIEPNDTKNAYEALGIAFKMQETAGNDYQNQTLGAFDIQILATQLSAETDSFDNKYDMGLDPDADGNILTEIDDVQYVYTPEGEYVLYKVTEAFAKDTLVVPEGVTSLGNYSFAYNSNVKTVVLSSTVRSLGRGFDSSAVETVVLNEGLEQIDSRAFKSTVNLKQVVISSTVKVIADNAFQKSGIKSIIIPATVETVGETAFGASEIETVIFEGNTSIQGYAFRGCPDLRTVYMNGDDVTFITSTLNGRNSTWFCNGESNNPNVSDIDFYVVNDTVAARVKAAMGAEAGNTDVIVKTPGEEVYDAATMGGLYELLPTLPAGTVLVIPEGTYTTTGTFTVAHGVTIKGEADKTVVFRQSSSAQDNLFNCAGDATFENITFETNRKGYAIADNTKNHDTAGDITVINCKFEGIAAEKNWGVYKNLYGNLTIENCTFDNYDNAICGVNNGGTSTTVITGCTFTNINGEAIGYVASTLPADFETNVIADNTGLTAGNVIGY
ncbi:MAG: hypothetical protein E7619_04075 [Ruminococcaceae bacterium]|nr:hypothetical protein [Oscillospiraceae bacterium]